MQMRTLRRATAVLAVAAISLTACSSDDGDDAGSDSGSDSGVEASEPMDEGSEPMDEMSDHDMDDMSEGETMSEGDAMAAEFTTLTEGELLICSDIPYAPFEFEEEGTATGYSGFDIELMEAVAAELDLTLAVSVTGFDAIQSGQALAADACDMAASAMTINDEREENVDFTDPYFDADQSLLVKGDAGFDSLAALDGALGVQADTTGQAYAQENFDGEILEFPGAAELFAALEAGTVVGILQDLPVNAERAQQDDTTAIVETFPTGEQYGFAAAEGNTALVDAVNAALATLMEDGTYDALYAKYFEA